MIHAGKIEFSDVVDNIKTEELIYNQIKKIDFPVRYVAVPLAYSINKLGLPQVQNLIDDIENKYPEKKFYVCQHICVKDLNFYNNIVFTPHTESSDNFEFIPHYNAIFEENPIVKRISDRNFNYSFIGDVNTHQSRFEITKIKLDNSLVESTGSWFFYKNNQEQQILKKKYIDVLTDSKISLCPRGTGVSTLRLFESLSTGTVPIIFNDLKLPNELKDSVYYKDMSLFISETKEINVDFVQTMSDFIYDYYWTNLSNNKLSKMILNFFNI